MVRLSKENGLNPTIFSCFYCGEDMGVALTGAAGDAVARKMGHSDGQMPTRCGPISMEPCDKCKEYMKQGVILIGVREEEPAENPYRTGEFIVVKDRAMRELLEGSPELLEAILEKRFAMVPQSALKAMGLVKEDGTLPAAEENGQDT